MCREVNTLICRLGDFPLFILVSERSARFFLASTCKSWACATALILQVQNSRRELIILV